VHGYGATLHLCFRIPSIYKARGIFADLRVVPINGRRMVYRSEVEALDRALEKKAHKPGDALRLVESKRA
jgi:hypothetical protein